MARPLRTRESAPTFDALDENGEPFRLDRLLGRPFVIFFYPKDETPGCIAEVCGFRDQWQDFVDLGVVVVGVSRDPPDSHKRFREARRLPYALLTDPTGDMTRAYGATMLGGLPRRVSYLVDAEGRVAHAYESSLTPATHPHAMLEAARSLVASK